jgi:putative ABC transport system substrate-binding protein
MKRYIALLRWTLAVILALAVMKPALAQAQQPAKVPRVGYLSSATPTPGTPLPALQAFQQRLGDLGYVEGRNIIVEYRWPEGRLDRLPELAAELVGLKVDVICVVGGVGAVAAKNATTTIPVVFAVVVDPVAGGLVANLERPGGNVTGSSTFDPQGLYRRQLELLKEVIPGLARVTLLGDQGTRGASIKAAEDQARGVGLKPQVLRPGGPNPDLEGVFEAATKARADAMLILENPLTATHRRRIAELATKHRLPTLFPREHVDAGGLIAYGPSLAEAARLMAAYMDKILKGAKPGDLPVDLVTRRELIINLKTAREIGVTIPADVLKRADQVIQ